MFATPYTMPGGTLFLEFFFNLRGAGVPVTTHNWIALIGALAKGLHGDSLDGFYQVARCLLVASEAHYDDFDRVFAQTFRGVAADMREMLSQLEEWLRDPKAFEGLDEATRAALRALDLEALHAKRLHLFGVSNKLRSPEQRAEPVPGFRADWLPLMAAGRLRPLVDRVFPFDQLPQAKACMEAGEHVGKIVLAGSADGVSA